MRQQTTRRSSGYKGLLSGDQRMMPGSTGAFRNKQKMEGSQALSNRVNAFVNTCQNVVSLHCEVVCRTGQLGMIAGAT